jgi:hypothetical protein
VYATDTDEQGEVPTLFEVLAYKLWALTESAVPIETSTLVPLDTADPTSVVQDGSVNSLTVLPLTTPLVVMVGVESRPGDEAGTFKVKPVGGSGGDDSDPALPPPLQPVKIINETLKQIVVLNAFELITAIPHCSIY